MHETGCYTLLVIKETLLLGTFHALYRAFVSHEKEKSFIKKNKTFSSPG